MAIYWASSWKVGERVPLEGRKGRRVGTGRGREGEGTTGTEGREESMSWRGGGGWGVKLDLWYVWVHY